MKIFLILIAVPVLLSSCLKQSISDAMLNSSKQTSATATLSYEINGSLQTTTFKDADHQQTGNHMLSCDKSNGFVLGCYENDFVFTFLTDTLKVGNYKYPGSWGPTYVVSYNNQPEYIYAYNDYMSVNITSYKDGHISGNFTGVLTPGNFNGGYGTPSSVVIKNGTFTNVPVFY